jgi:hypothetical protein
MSLANIVIVPEINSCSYGCEKTPLKRTHMAFMTRFAMAKSALLRPRNFKVRPFPKCLARWPVICLHRLEDCPRSQKLHVIEAAA